MVHKSFLCIFVRDSQLLFNRRWSSQLYLCVLRSPLSSSVRGIQVAARMIGIVTSESRVKSVGWSVRAIRVMVVSIVVAQRHLFLFQMLCPLVYLTFPVFLSHSRVKIVATSKILVASVIRPVKLPSDAPEVSVLSPDLPGVIKIIFRCSTVLLR